jgi:hypothetical protein
VGECGDLGVRMGEDECDDRAGDRAAGRRVVGRGRRIERVLRGRRRVEADAGLGAGEVEALVADAQGEPAHRVAGRLALELLGGLNHGQARQVDAAGADAVGDPRRDCGVRARRSSSERHQGADQRGGT